MQDVVPISIRYPLVELAGGVMAVIVGLVYGATIQTALLCLVAGIISINDDRFR